MEPPVRSHVCVEKQLKILEWKKDQCWNMLSRERGNVGFTRSEVSSHCTREWSSRF